MSEARRLIHETLSPGHLPSGICNEALVAGLRCALLNHFGVDGDGNVVADDYAAVVHGGVPLHAVVLTIDYGGGVDGGALIAPRIFHGRGRAIDIEHDLLGDAVNGQVASDLQFAGAGLLDLGGFEGHGGEVGDVEEMIAH